MDLTGKFLVVWLSAEAVETFLGVLPDREESAMTSWLVGGTVVGESGPGLWLKVRQVTIPSGQDLPLREEPTYFLRWELVTTARLYERPPEDIGRLG